MRGKGCEGASTIHSLIYRARESGEEVPSFDLWDEAPASKAELIVIDECSMVDAELGRDLMSFGVPLLVLGDPAQLPPIQGGGFFTEAEPDAMLTEVHRQAADNPIIRLSMDIRAGEVSSPGATARPKWSRKRRSRSAARDRRRSGAGRAQRDAARLQHAHARAARLRRTNCRRPATSSCACATTAQGPVQRRAVDGEGDAGDRAARHHDHAAAARRRDRRHAASRCRCGRNASPATSSSSTGRSASTYDEFDYGYVLTVHKAQGSQWDDVVLFDESFAFPDSRERWLYTGVTRAAKRLTVVM